MKTSFTTFDVIAIIAILVPAARCLFRGFTKEILSLIGLIGGIILGRMFCGPAGSLFHAWVKSQWALNAIGFVIVYFVINTACVVTSLFLSKLMRKTALSSVDRLGGFALGALKGVLIAGLFVLLVNSVAGSIDHSFLATSILARPLLGFMKLLTGIVIPAAKHAAISGT
jgi:membrane protein required for colicin V production